MIWWSLVYFPQGFLTFKKYSHFKFLNMAWSSPYMQEKTKMEVKCTQLQPTGGGGGASNESQITRILL